LHSEDRPQLIGGVKGEEVVVGMDVNGCARGSLQLAAAARVIDMAMCEQYTDQ
jgi:hypothetical protein